MLQGLAVHVLEDEKDLPILLDDVEHLHDVRMIDMGNQPRLGEEPSSGVLLVSEMRVEMLERDGPREAKRPAGAPEIDGAHAAGRDEPHDGVPTDIERQRAREGAPPRVGRLAGDLGVRSLESCGEGTDATPALVPVHDETASDGGDDARREVASATAEWDRLSGRDLMAEAAEVLRREGRLTAEDEVESDPDRPDVGPVVDLARELLGRHVAGRAEEVGLRRERRDLGADERPARNGLGQAEVQHLHDVLAAAHLCQEQVRRLDVAMDDACLVRLGERIASLEDVAERLLDGERALAGDLRPEVHSREPLHHDERLAGLRHVDVEDLNGVAALQRSGCARLAGEAVDDLRLADVLGVDHLDRDVLAEIHVPRGEDAAHAARAELALDRVLAGQELLRRRARLLLRLQHDDVAAARARDHMRPDTVLFVARELSRHVEEDLLLGRAGGRTRRHHEEVITRDPGGAQPPPARPRWRTTLI